MSDVKNVTVGPSFLGLLTILFVGLKLTNYIDWSWWWVLSPIWIPVAIVCFIIAIAGVFIGIAAIKDKARIRHEADDENS